jgi:hypothetical protein
MLIKQVGVHASPPHPHKPTIPLARPPPKNKTLINNCQNFHDAQKMQIVSEERQDAFE